MPQIHLRVITPERTLIDGLVDEVVLPTKTGQIAVLPNHIPLIAEIIPGDIIVKAKGDDKVTVVYGGFIYVKENSEVLVLADSAEHLHELNEAEILAAKKRAEEARDSVGKDHALFAESEAELARISTQLRSINRHSGIKRRHNKEI